MRHAPPSPARFRPRLEALDARALPSVSFAFDAGVLRVDGGLGADQVALNDFGNGTVAAYSGGVTHTFGGVTQVRVTTNRGNDVVNHVLHAAQVSNIQYDIDLGNGDDLYTSDVNADVAGLLLVTVRGDLGNDRIYADLAGDVFAGAYTFWARGEAGDDEIQVFANQDVDVLSTGFVAVDVDGGTGNDALLVLYKGAVDDRLHVGVDGGSYDDVINVQVTLDPGSTGTCDAVVAGGSGGDDLTFFVSKFFKDPVGIDAEVAGGLGFDTARVSATFVQYGTDIEFLFLV